MATTTTTTTAHGKWTTGLCGCFSDIPSCCLTWFCPCISVGQIVNAVDEGKTSCLSGCLIFCVVHYLTGLGCLYTCIYRNKLRDRYQLPEEPCADVLTDCCCLPCSICQTYRELQNRGVDLYSGGGQTSNQPPSASAPPLQHMHK